MTAHKNKRRKNMPEGIRIVTENEAESKKIVAEAMAEMYRRMCNPM